MDISLTLPLPLPLPKAVADPICDSFIAVLVLLLNFFRTIMAAMTLTNARAETPIIAEVSGGIPAEPDSEDATFWMPSWLVSPFALLLGAGLVVGLMSMRVGSGVSALSFGDGMETVGTCVTTADGEIILGAREGACGTLAPPVVGAGAFAFIDMDMDMLWAESSARSSRKALMI